MKEECKSSGAICKTEWTVSHKASIDWNQMEIIVGGGEKLEIGIMSIPVGKATPATIEEIERKISEAFQLLQSESTIEQDESLELRVGINENTGAQEVYFSNKNGVYQLVVSSADFEV